MADDSLDPADSLSLSPASPVKASVPPPILAPLPNTLPMAPVKKTTAKEEDEGNGITAAKHSLRSVWTATVNITSTAWRWKNACFLAGGYGAAMLWYFNPWGAWDKVSEGLRQIRPWLVGTNAGRAVLFFIVIWALWIGWTNFSAVRAVKKVHKVSRQYDDTPVKNLTALHYIKTPENIRDVYPYAPVQIPAISATYMMNLRADLIKRLSDAIPLSNEDLDEHLLPVIYNVAAFIHQAPASADDHHAGVGGLFTHSLEVALYAANEAKNTVFERFGMPKQVYQAKGRWVLAAAYAGLTHDIGKAICDMQMTASASDNSVTLVWDPQHSTLLRWLRKNHFSSYTIDYRNQNTAAAYDAHKSVSARNLYRVIPQKSKAFLSQYGLTEIPLALENAVEYTKEDAGGVLGKILHRADATSAAQNRLLTRGSDAVSRRVYPILEAIKRLLKEGLKANAQDGSAVEPWSVNKEGAQVYNTTAGCFIVWNPTLAGQIRRKALAMDYNNIPEDPERIAAVLGDNGYLKLNPDRENDLGQNYWLITPITQQVGYIRCVCIDQPNRILADPLPVKIEVVVKGQPIPASTVTAWQAKWKTAPKQILEAEEAASFTSAPEAQGITQVEVGVSDQGDVVTMESKAADVVETQSGEVVFLNHSDADADAYFASLERAASRVGEQVAAEAAAEAANPNDSGETAGNIYPTETAERISSAETAGNVPAGNVLEGAGPDYLDAIPDQANTIPDSPPTPGEQAFLNRFNKTLEANVLKPRASAPGAVSTPATPKKPQAVDAKTAAQKANAARLIGKPLTSVAAETETTPAASPHTSEPPKPSALPAGNVLEEIPSGETAESIYPTETAENTVPGKAVEENDSAETAEDVPAGNCGENPPQEKRLREDEAVSEPQPDPLPPIIVKEPDFSRKKPNAAKKPVSGKVAKTPPSVAPVSQPAEEAPKAKDPNEAKKERSRLLQALYLQLAEELKSGKGELIQGPVNDTGATMEGDCTPFLQKASLSAAKAGAFFLWCNGQPWHKPMTFQAGKKPLAILKVDRTKETAGAEEEDEAGLDF